ncbi:MAG: DUF1592 domain-containing protein [Pseudomonadota bacterium]
MPSRTSPREPACVLCDDVRREDVAPSFDRCRDHVPVPDHPVHGHRRAGRSRGTTQDVNAVTTLTDYELASALSYALWDTAPDDALYGNHALCRIRCE